MAGAYYKARILGLKGQTDQAVLFAQRLELTGFDPAAIAQLFAVGKQKLSSVRWLRAADEQHSFLARLLARYASDFDSFRSSGEYSALLAEVGHPRVP